MTKPLILLIYISFALVAADKGARPLGWEGELMDLIDTIRQEARLTSYSTGRGDFAESTYAALRKTPRHLFVPPALRALAYFDQPLPIGYGQTISQPYIVALMTDLLEVKAYDRVLEIGTGSGYQAAVLSHLAKEVYTIEIIDKLGEAAQKRFEDAGLKNVLGKVGDGYYGWPDKSKAPFDGILVTAAASHIPPPLLKQLKVGGRLVIPVGPPFQTQYLTVVTKTEKGVETKRILPVQFVPFTGAINE
ncbi:MAG: protein-L-isoaspartate(D-aspartate) O-methyltransferase [Deltaproteobacteria bacterium]|nr:protein-L-isoaspartate(D-aspartate) O-methyltransferase [Deltaproteobacteria bacterium]